MYDRDCAMLWLALLLLLAFPAAAGAATASVQPYVEPPDTDPFGSCSRYMMCPPDMLVFDGAPGETNQVTVTEESEGFQRLRYVVRDDGAPVQAGAGCRQVDAGTVECTAATVGPVRLGDGDDRLTARSAQAWGGQGADVLSVEFGRLEGGGGGDVLTGALGDGGGGDDRLVVSQGEGGPGEDVMKCPPEGGLCTLDGGPGDDRLTGSDLRDRLFGRGGDDVLHGRRELDTIEGNRGDDRLFGGPSGDFLRGGFGADRLFARETRFSGAFLDRADCGPGGRDRAIADRRDATVRCELVRRAAP
jgi:Ca2+-binding RTX toxin-like protein